MAKIIPAFQRENLPGEPLDPTGGDGNSGGMDGTYEHRLTRVEDDLCDIKGEVRNLRWWILGVGIGIVSAVIGLAQFQASWFQHSLDQNKEYARAANDKADKTLERIDQKFEVFQQKLDALKPTSSQPPAPIIIQVPAAPPAPPKK